MIDIHAHVVYGIDDGPSSIHESVEMIKNASMNGINQIFLTSHYMEDGYKCSTLEYVKRVNNIKRKLKREHIDVKLYYGNEVMIYPNLAEDINTLFYSLNRGKYVLIELPMFEECLYVQDVINKIKEKGYVPIIAHPERYLYAQKDFKILENLMESGALFQINLGSICGAYGKDAKKVAKKLLKNKMVHFVASDSHSPNAIYKSYFKMLDTLKRYVDAEYFEWIIHRFPEKII